MTFILSETTVVLHAILVLLITFLTYYLLFLILEFPRLTFNWSSASTGAVMT